MAETAVMFVLDKLTPFLANEVQLISGGREEVVYVRAELERMKVFLRIFDRLDETDEEVKVWVKQIRDVAHDIEDVLDEFSLLLAHNHGDGFYGFLHKLSCCIKNMKARYRIGYEIQGINSRIRSIYEGHNRLRQKFRAAEQAGSSSTNTWNDRRGDALLLDETDLAVETMSSDGLKKIIKDFLQERRYLIVLDDVWHINDWDGVKYALPTNNCGSRVMLTTRNADLAFTSRIESEGQVYNMQPLPPEESWILFCTKTFHGNACPPHLEEICRCILKKCEGLPLAIVAIGGVLAAKDRRRIDEWEIVRRSLGAQTTHAKHHLHLGLLSLAIK
ncbi:hypothetical protein Patl1_03610 [Pistacia atlantica]|uniref:Uncharacterized protein n=1 Tax=Pistacia atlantica TaxID=434234 RepID=A0ACC1C8X1_9ROSI|nr:hypothetical protein Patl1_03610 [Pistacia atlantica]